MRRCGGRRPDAGGVDRADIDLMADLKAVRGEARRLTFPVEELPDVPAGAAGKPSIARRELVGPL